MSLKTFDLCYHFKDEPNKIKRHDLLTSTLESAKAWLRDQYSDKSIMIHFIVEVPKPKYITKKCRFCRQSRQEEIKEPRPIPADHWKPENWTKL